MRVIRRVLLVLVAGVILVLAIAGFARYQQQRQAELAEGLVTTDIAELPEVEVGLVLGTGPLTTFRSGRVAPNRSFVARLDSAAALWKARKVRYLLLSGKRDGPYDEPTIMREGLIDRGVPARVIYRDYAGYRTLDSILRARSIFGLTRMVIVSQPTHLPRALYLAKSSGIEAWGLAARETPPSQPRLFEIYLATVALVAWWDVLVGTQPREAGPPVAIGADAAD